MAHALRLPAAVPTRSTEVIPDAPRVAGAHVTMTVEAMPGLTALDTLGATWNRVVEQSDADHVFSTAEWVRTWSESFATPEELLTLVVREAGEVRAIAPLVCRQRRSGVAYERVEAIYNAHTPRFDVIVSDSTGGAYRALWQALAPRRSFGSLELREIPATSPTLRTFSEFAVRDGLLVGLRPDSESPYVDIRGSWNDYEASLDRLHVRNLRRHLRNLSRLGHVSLETVTGGPGLRDALPQALSLEAAAWKGAAGTAISCDPSLVRFYTVLAERAAARGWLRLEFLTVNGRRVAVAIGVLYRNRLYSLKTGYDPALSMHSPGQLLWWLSLQQAFEERIDAYDLLGSNDSWKLVWTPNTRPHRGLTILPASLAGRVRHATRFELMPRVRATRLYAGCRDLHQKIQAANRHRHHTHSQPSSSDGEAEG